ncbi:lipid storage droplets surface-binding protein 1 isoform X5 [Pieris napi]|uniref:lipid storage droplets surface-binding protein 1 isoform X5 n=1 Tax=Pieris napi TaxID=78633 RepID=UPI001FBB9A09|nr:lipid storage droplets surface-binding protein 1 isoform X5 [Pieris napi]
MTSNGKGLHNGDTVSIEVNKRAQGIVARMARNYLRAVKESQERSTVSATKSGLPRLESLERVSQIPIVESGIGVTEKIYSRIRESNALIRWYFTLGEKSLGIGVQLALPAVQLLETPIHQLDRFLCKSLDVVEKQVPSIYLPPQAIYTETRRFVIRRADSVKQLGTAVLDSRVTAVTATALDRALTTADKYVDKYLPPDQQDASDESGDGSGRARAEQALQHGARFGRKLQRRLTRQALAEAKAIKEQIHVLVYVAELVAKDPVLAWKKAKELYASLSQSEPENQARPATLEELVVLLARETARKVVHLINYTHSDLPKNVRQGLSVVTSHLSAAADALLKGNGTTINFYYMQKTPVENAITEVRTWSIKLTTLLQQLQDSSKSYLEHLAMFLAGNEEREKITPRSVFQQRDDLASFNGVN